MSVAEDFSPRGFVSMREVRRLQARIEELEAEIAHMRGDDLPECMSPDVFMREFNLEPACALTLRILLNLNEPISQLRLARRMSSTDSRNSASVAMGKLRRALAKAGAPENCIPRGGWHGYALSPEGRAWLVKRLEGRV